MEKTRQQPVDAPDQKQLTLVETSFVESVDRRHPPGIDRHQMDGHEPVMERHATKEVIQIGMRSKAKKLYVPKHLRREANKAELDGFHKRVKRVPKGMTFEEAYYKYRLGNFFRESRETEKDMEILFNKVCRKPKRTLKKEQDPGKFLIPCSINNHDLPNALCDTGSAVSIMAIDTAEVLGLNTEPSKDSFGFIDNSKANSAGMIRNVKVEIGECTIPVDFHVVELKSGRTSPLLFGRAFMATVGAVFDLKKNRMCLTNVDENAFYDPVEKKKSEDLISYIEMFEDPALLTYADRELAKSGSTSIDIQLSRSVDNEPHESTDTEPLESCQEESLECRVRRRGGPASFAKVKVLSDPKLRDKGEASARAFINFINQMRKRDTETCSRTSSHPHPD
ncbi:uncharacterized protein LOC130503759 [Raphanus sativus]|uniref:Uncharacterized protein LOC130503759 n=1 Tax=Raphanus sativus TaxID=3726 RepID=A0A9W3CRR8_RAPSA|nr:uncharacterized protein LOC130503759 [Raphanus sativus]